MGIDGKGIRDLIKRYLDNGGEVFTLEEGCSGYGTIILHDYTEKNNLLSFKIQEYYLNEWSSGHKLTTYRKGLPKKYHKMIEKIYG